MPGEVIMTIDKDGNKSFEVKGILGTKCTDITQALNQGAEVMDEQYTSEYCMDQEIPDYIENLDGDSTE